MSGTLGQRGLRFAQSSRPLISRSRAIAASLACAVIAAAANARADAQARTFTLADLASVVKISVPQISPDGRRAVALISRIDTEHNRDNDEIDLVDIATGSRRALTFERTGLASPKWSPDGSRIAFIADNGRGENAHGQIYVMPLGGGDPTRVTAAPEVETQSAIWRSSAGAKPVRIDTGGLSTLSPLAGAIADDLDSDLYLFRGSPFVARHRARWVHEQSITYVADVTTPVLLMADRGDARVANVSSYEFFHALRDLGKPVQFVVYPVDGHFPHDPARTADVLARWVNYIGDHFTL